ncbi:Periplasmic binding protein OS=Tsukamurella paurometabola (strain ATCC 8368 / DSM / CCUG 35730/ CIP 100753 / JCM 10117 / KCTC 9821 / NBRC 16120 / NCIMB 702349 / NCTC 13040) OX=521096 GN=Tpau_2943 PE=4 SV=1 [Tsukamurella paurometabola]|uniref:Periplasmic binding protein n=2 Tax=Tsukamurella paurometabola TaxID=2061 RepID=D5UU38_TSUPD|nr:periplasmic binding protein [Tsukamurella paurometabola DSM 20162]SUP36152.1 Probable siderophore-binding lipoprotein yfiY precursor [Tsukamurella paurometabola]
MRMVAMAAAAMAAVSACGGQEPIQQPFASIATTTTRLASANIIGLDRKADQACAAPLAGTAAPASIVVADPDLLDGLCALGLQNRVKAVGGAVPSYLGGTLAKVPQLGDGAQADLVVGTDRSGEANRRAGRAVVVPSPSADWRRSFLALADAVRLPAEARSVLDRYQRDVADATLKIDAIHNVVSLVRFTADKRSLAEGTAPLAAQVLSDLRVARPEPQRKAEPVLMRDGDFSAAEGDLIYVGYQGEQGRDFGMEQMTSKSWKDLRAVTAKRQLLVEDSSWFSAGGPVAAGIVVHDVTNTIKASS